MNELWSREDPDFARAQEERTEEVAQKMLHIHDKVDEGYRKRGSSQEKD